MRSAAVGFLVTLAASVGGAAIAAAIAAGAVLLHPLGSGGVPPALWLLAMLPVAAALVTAGALARTNVAVLLNSLAFVLPQAAALAAVFFLFSHPGGGAGFLLAARDVLPKLAAGYVAVAVLVGAASLVFRRVRRVRRPPGQRDSAQE